MLQKVTGLYMEGALRPPTSGLDSYFMNAVNGVRMYGCSSVSPTRNHLRISEWHDDASLNPADVTDVVVRGLVGQLAGAEKAMVNNTAQDYRDLDIEGRFVGGTDAWRWTAGGARAVQQCRFAIWSRGHAGLLFNGPSTWANIQRVDLRPLFGQATWNPASVATGATVTTTIAVAGAVLGDRVEFTFAVSAGGLVPFAYVSAVDVVTVGFMNATGAGVDLASGMPKVWVYKV
jgi:hypothetical protein